MGQSSRTVRILSRLELNLVTCHPLAYRILKSAKTGHQKKSIKMTQRHQTRFNSVTLVRRRKVLLMTNSHAKLLVCQHCDSESRCGAQPESRGFPQNFPGNRENSESVDNGRYSRLVAVTVFRIFLSIRVTSRLCGGTSQQLQLRQLHSRLTTLDCWRISPHRRSITNTVTSKLIATRGCCHPPPPFRDALTTS